MPAWLLKLLQPLYQLIAAKAIDFLKQKFDEFMQERADKKKLKEVLREKDPVKRANALRDFLNGK